MKSKYFRKFWEGEVNFEWETFIDDERHSLPLFLELLKDFQNNLDQNIVAPYLGICCNLSRFIKSRGFDDFPCAYELSAAFSGRSYPFGHHGGYLWEGQERAIRVQYMKEMEEVIEDIIENGGYGYGSA